MKKALLILIFVIVSAQLFMRCKKDCNSKQLDDKNFTPQELAIVPYNGSETLVYKNFSGDSICFTGQGRTSNMNPSVSNPDHDENECAGDTRNAESNYVSFKCGNTDTTLNIGLRFFKPFDDYENEKLISFTYTSTGTVSPNFFYGTYRFYNDTIVNPIIFWQDSYFISAYYNSLTLLNKTFNRVYELTFFNSHGRTLYYNVLQGVVGYKEYSGTIWYLDKIN